MTNRIYKNKEYFPVQVGDQVMINPEYWAKNQHRFIEPYKSNGVDYIYTVTKVSGYGDPNLHQLTINVADKRLTIDLNGYDDGWDNDLEYLIPVPSESELGGLGDVSELFE